MSSEDSDPLPTTSVGTRKRLRRPETWKKHSAKKKRNSGKAYESGEPKGGHVAAREIGAACKCGCFPRVGREYIEEIFSSFWAIGDWDMQNEYLAGIMESTECARSRVTDRPSRRLRSVTYHVKKGDEKIKVCAVAFRNIHGLKERRLRTVQDKVTSSGIVEKDKRGLNKKKLEVSDERKKEWKCFNVPLG